MCAVGLLARLEPRPLIVGPPTDEHLELNVAGAGRDAQSLGRTTVVLRVSEDVAFFFREVETL